MPERLSKALQQMEARAIALLARREYTRAELARRLARLVAAGYSVFGEPGSGDLAAELLRAQYLCMQYIHLMDDSGEVLS